ncbi:MAG: transposase [Candidatus Micrarchaeaceae archaeon]
MNNKQIRGLEIAQTQRILKQGHEWIVPSQSGHGNYAVTMNMEGRHPFRKCTCPDHESSGLDCKHIYAVLYAEKLIAEQPDTSVKSEVPDKVYTQNWSAYNKSQIEEKDTFLKLLAELADNVPDSIGEPTGRPKLPMRDMVFVSAMKVYTTFSSRRFMSDMRMALESGYLSKGCAFSSISNYMMNPELTPVLHLLITMSALPLKSVETKFAIDSTGFRTTTFSDYCKVKHHTTQEHEWIKGHIMCGVKTNIITGIEITDGEGGDSPQFIPLVEEAANNGFTLEEVSADKAYSSRENLSCVDRLGGTAFIPYKSNATGKSGGSRIWHKMYNYFVYNREEFMHHYHLRSNVETTNFMIKSKFGDFVRSKDSTARINEVLLKVLCHNIVVLIHEMNELGIKPVTF